MNYNETLELLKKIAKSCENVALLKGRGSSCTVIVFEGGYEYRHMFTPDHLKKTVTDPEGRTLYEGSWLIGDNSEFSFDGDWGEKSLLRLESDIDTIFTAYFPMMEKTAVNDAEADDGLHIYTDGSCRVKKGQKTGHGAWGFLCIRNGGIVASASNYMPKTTSHNMELMAITYALKTAKKMDVPRIVIHSDAKDIIEMVNLGVDHANPPVCYDRDLWQRFISLLSSIEAPVSWHWVKGHNGDRWNEMVNAQVQAITGRKFNAPPRKKAQKKGSPRA